MNCETLYYNTYGRFPDSIAFCPYRISPLGAHIDHQYGKAEEIERSVTDKYLRTYPHLIGRYSFHLCDSADGVKL